MNDWKRFSVANLISNGILFIGDGYRAKNEELANHGIPFARVSNINDGFHFEDADRFPEKDLHKVGNKISNEGDVVFTSKGTVGRFAFVKEGVERFVYSPQLCFWRVLDTQTIDPHFLFFWMFGREFFLQINGVKSQTDMADYVSLIDQRNMYITLPPLPEQHAIAGILSALDDKVEVNRRMNITLEAMARAMFRQWFVDSGNNANWEEKSLDEIADFLNGLALQKYPAEDEDYLPVIKISQLRTNDTGSADKASINIPSQYIVEDGDILFSWSGSLVVVAWCGGKGALNQHLFKVTSEKYPKWFYYYWTKYHLADFQEIAAGKATTMGHIQRHHLKEAKVLVPSDEELKEMDKVMSPLLDKIILNNLESRTLGSLRDSLLPKLMKGEVRVKDVEKIL
jgi:type I restriction enzyme, S subunit